MKIKQYCILIVIVMFFFGCSSDDDHTPVPPKISFVHADGSKIADNECISPSVKYAIKIEINSIYNKKAKPVRIDYSVNGVLYTMTFSNNGSQINPITLVDGNNMAQIVGSEYKVNLKYIDQGDFKLVE